MHVYFFLDPNQHSITLLSRECVWNNLQPKSLRQSLCKTAAFGLASPYFSQDDAENACSLSCVKLAAGTWILVPFVMSLQILPVCNFAAIVSVMPMIKLQLLFSLCLQFLDHCASQRQRFSILLCYHLRRLQPCPGNALYFLRDFLDFSGQVGRMCPSRPSKPCWIHTLIPHFQVGNRSSG